MIYSADRVCPKCGHDDVSTVYCPGLAALHEAANQSRRSRPPEWQFKNPPICVEVDAREKARPSMGAIMSLGATPGGYAAFSGSGLDKLLMDEHLERRCGRCTYGWCEKPLDKAPPLMQLAAQAAKPNEMNDNPK